MTITAILPGFNDEVSKVTRDIIRTRVNQVAIETEFDTRSWDSCP